MAPTPNAVRRECYRRIVEAAKNGLSEYYAKYPERAADARSEAAAEWSLQGIRRILEILKDYDISRRPQ